MQTIITNFLNASAMNVEPAVIWALLFVYVTLVAATVADIFCSKTSVKRKLIWSVFVVACPSLGVVLYCIVCLLRGDYSVLVQMGFSKKNSSNKMHAGTKIATILPKNQSLNTSAD
jgi:hypothetical protein